MKFLDNIHPVDKAILLSLCVVGLIVTVGVGGMALESWNKRRQCEKLLEDYPSQVIHDKEYHQLVRDMCNLNK